MDDNPTIDGGPTAGDRRLATLAEEFWTVHLEARPIAATAYGDRRFDDRLSDRSAEALARQRGSWRRLRAATDALAPHDLGPTDQITRTELIDAIDAELTELDVDLDAWTIDPLEGPQVTFLNLESFQVVDDPAAGAAMVRRWLAMGPWLDRHAEELRSSAATGRVAVRSPIEKSIDELRELEATPDDALALLAPARVDRPGWSTAEQRTFAAALTDAVTDVVRPAFQRYRTTLERDILPLARPDDRPGLLHLAGGPDAYRALTRLHTSLDRSPDEIHAIGLAEVARINAETELLGRRVLGTATRAATIERLRRDPMLHFETRAEVLATAHDALARAVEAVPRFFGRVPRAACEVVVMGDHEARHSTIAYYLQPDPDGGRLGRYYLNTSAPETRPRYEAEALAFHEAVPGHHLQISIGQELEGMPTFRRHLGPTAFFEGWGLYAERLSDEMGLYTSDLDRLGILSFDSWRACRLVVDTGLHALGWTREQAVRFMLDNSALAENNVVNEVDRYIVWPGQALAYKTGQLEMLRLRDVARAALGQRFDVRAFHDVLLGSGAVALGTLAAIVESWIAGYPRG